MEDRLVYQIGPVWLISSFTCLILTVKCLSILTANVFLYLQQPEHTNPEVFFCVGYLKYETMSFYIILYTNSIKLTKQILANTAIRFNENSKLSPIIKRVEGDIPIRHLLPSGIYHG